jgi:tol-pal system protein YbgF
MKAWVCLSVLAAISFTASGQSTKDQLKDVIREIAQIEDQLRTMQRTQDEKNVALTLLLQQTREAADKASTAMAVMQTTINERLGEQSKAVGGTVAGVGNKVDQMADEFRAVKESIADLGVRMGKLDAKLAELSNTVRTIQAPPAAPPGGGLAPTGAAPSATGTYESAIRDYNGGKMDLAMQEFQEYLKYYPQTDFAPNAQFYIGEIYLRQNDAENAIKAYDAVLERYPENNKTPDARYMKAKALFQAGQKTAAQKEYCEVVKRYPDSDVATKAKSALRGMGFSPSCGVTASSSSKRKRK